MDKAACEQGEQKSLAGKEGLTYGAEICKMKRYSVAVRGREEMEWAKTQCWPDSHKEFPQGLCGQSRKAKR